jgi:hypothetical protein
MRASILIWFLAASLILLALGGLYGGLSMLLDPTGGLLQMEEVLPQLLVPDYLLPGVFLVVVMGLFPLLLTYALLRRPHWAWAEALPRLGRQNWAWTASLLLSVVLTLWLALQAALIGFRWPIQYVTALNGLLILALLLTHGVRTAFRRSSRRHHHRHLVENRP